MSAEGERPLSVLLPPRAAPADGVPVVHRNKAEALSTLLGQGVFVMQAADHRRSHNAEAVGSLCLCFVFGTISLVGSGKPAALRPVGGLLSDRVGGYRMRCFCSPEPPYVWRALQRCRLVPVAVMLLLVVVMAMLGMGNGAVFQLVPQRFAGRVGIMTGIAGAARGFGGFALPSILGAIKDDTGTFGLGFALFSGAVLAGPTALLRLGRKWRERWDEESAVRAGLLPGRTEIGRSETA